MPEVLDLSGELDRITDGNRIARPPVTRSRDGRWKRADAGEWDWFYGLQKREQDYIRDHHMSDLGVQPDIVATWHGTDVDTVMTAWADAIRVHRRHLVISLDPLDDDFPGLEPEPEPANTGALDLVGPSEVALRAGVSRSAVSQWRKRHPDFPAPLAVLGAGRRAPGGGDATGTPVWTWPDVQRWLVATNRAHRLSYDDAPDHSLAIVS